jgi:hypothetical protein
MGISSIHARRSRRAPPRARARVCACLSVCVRAVRRASCVYIQHTTHSATQLLHAMCWVAGCRPARSGRLDPYTAPRSCKPVLGMGCKRWHPRACPHMIVRRNRRIIVAQSRADATTTKLPMPVTVTAICTGEIAKLAKFSCGAQ